MFYRYKGDVCIKVHNTLRFPTYLMLCVSYFHKQYGYEYYHRMYGMKKWVRISKKDFNTKWEHFIPKWSRV